jgi:Tol biopolymer transport system component
MPLPVGTRIGPYETLAFLDAGGMGEVYRARDTRLHRDVALKVLPARLTDDTDRLARFKREAQVLASLSHPNIAAIHGLEEADGIHALAMEFVDGPTLADTIARGPIPLEDALPIAHQIAEALEAAHHQAIVHRDLKPANVKVRPDGVVKVLDFGLAKLVDPSDGMAALGDMTHMPTVTTPAHLREGYGGQAMTQAGMILGTAAYMSPQQAKGRPVDQRADVWAFGCVLFEMLTGRRAFAGDDVSDTLAEVLKSEPNWAALPASMPEPVRRLLRRCLVKDEKQRLPDIGSARLEIDDAIAAPATGTATQVTTSRRSAHERLAWGATALAATVAAVLGGLLLSRGAANPARVAPETRLQVTAPEPDRRNVQFALSPDGRRLAFGGGGLWIRALDSEVAQPFAAAGATVVRPFWSPSGRSIAFLTGGELKRIDLDSGLVRTLARSTNQLGGTWGSQGDILFVPAPSSPVLRIAEGGGTPMPVTRLAPGQVGHRHPTFLPDGQRFIYLAVGTQETRGLYVGTLGSTDSTRLMELDSEAVFAPPDAVLFMRGGELFAQRLDLARLVLAGEAVQVAAQVHVGTANFNRIAVTASAEGTIAYRPGDGSERLVWFDREGRQQTAIGEPYSVPAQGTRLSKNGAALVQSRAAKGNLDVWLIDLVRGGLQRITTEEVRNVGAALSPDNARIAFGSERSGVYDIYMKSVGGQGSESLVVSSPRPKLVADWSPDGRSLLYDEQHPETGRDIWVLPLEGQKHTDGRGTHAGGGRRRALLA